MASVFLSYDHDDDATAAPIAAALEAAGHDVWWDRQIHGGAEYNSEIESAVERADAVVVLWSERSVRSPWVRDEAAEGRDRGRLVPVALDDARPPMGFRQYQTIPLGKPKGRKTGIAIDPVLHAIDKVMGRAPATKPIPASTMPQPSSRARLLWIAAAALLLATIVGLLIGRPWALRSSALVAVSAADSSAISQDYARDLLAQLGQLQAAKPDSLQLVGADARKRAGMVFEVSGASEGQTARANLMLLNGKTDGLLWSRAFERPVQQVGDLRQQLSFAAAQVLQCAVEAHSAGGAAVKPETLKLYLNGCADLANGDSDLSGLIPVFRQVTRAAPHFEGAWRNLLSVESDTVVQGEYFNPDTELIKQLGQDMKSARRVNPQMAQAFLAEADLAPLNDFRRRLALADRAVAAEPNEAYPYTRRSAIRTAVGQVDHALDDAKRAVDLSPISPGYRFNYIMALAQAGRTDAAQEELAKAERIWPGSSMADNAKFAFHFRFGDPRIAWQMIQSGKTAAGWVGARNFIQARLTRKPDDIDEAIAEGRAAYARNRFAFQHLVQVMSILDREDDLFQLLMHAPIADAIYVTDVTFRPAAREFWRNPRSLQYAKRVGLLQYWSSSGEWPDFCEDTDLPYRCPAEAAKLLR